MDKRIFTFWEGPFPEYLKLCMKTWKFPYTVLNYDNVNNYTDIQIKLLKRFTLPQIADYVRVHVLRDYGGYWLDTDTIVLGDLPEENIGGDTVARTNTIGVLHTEPHSEMFTKWAKYQDSVVYNPMASSQNWAIMGNEFTDDYIKQHEEIKIFPIQNCWPETYMINDGMPRFNKYQKFYFEKSYHLSDINQTNLLMLHNSWTPDWYKKLSRDKIFAQNCTLSNILKEVLS